MKPMILVSAAALVLFGAGCAATPEPVPTPTPVPPAPPVEAPPTPPESITTTTTMPLAFPGVRPDAEVNKKVRIKTTAGDIVIQVDPKAGPNAASNFVYLIENKFYDGTIFHRVIPGFMIQGGDPTGTGTSGPGYQFPNDNVTTLQTREVITDTGRKITMGMYAQGIVAMANAGRDTNGSQFFIMVDGVELPIDYSVFGHVILGQDVANKIAAMPRNADDRPTQEVKMVSVTVE